jgi:hypothetical protein
VARGGTADFGFRIFDFGLRGGASQRTRRRGNHEEHEGHEGARRAGLEFGGEIGDRGWEFGGGDERLTQMRQARKGTGELIHRLHRF